MGISNSKKNKNQPIIDAFIPPKEKKPTYGDLTNESLLKFCINNEQAELLTAIETGTSLASPYHDVPLLFSAVLGLLNDENHEQFKNNWNILRESFNHQGNSDQQVQVKIPFVDELNITLTNYTQDMIYKRKTSYPIFHIGTLSKNLVQTEYKYFKQLELPSLKHVDLKRVLLFIMSNTGQFMKDITKNEDPNVFTAYKNTSAQKMAEIIKVNAKYIIDNMNSLDSIWDKSMDKKTYYDQYSDEYTMEEIPYATPVPLSQEQEESGKK